MADCFIPITVNSYIELTLKYYYGGRNASQNRIERLMMLREDGRGVVEYF